MCVCEIGGETNAPYMRISAKLSEAERQNNDLIQLLQGGLCSGGISEKDKTNKCLCFFFPISIPPDRLTNAAFSGLYIDPLCL